MQIKRRLPRLCLVTLVALLLTIPTTMTVSAANAKNGLPGDYIVVYKDGASNASIQSFVKSARTMEEVSVKQTWTHALKGFQARLTPAAKRQLEADPNVAFVTRNRPVSLPEVIDHSLKPLQQVPASIDRIEADLSSTKAGDGNGTVDEAVAVVDTGVEKNNPDLNVVGGVNCTSKNANAWQDEHGHGTHVAATIGAKDNKKGVVGVAPETPIYAVRVLNRYGSGSWATVICGANWLAATHVAKVANWSLGGNGSSDDKCGWKNKDPFHVAICMLEDEGTLSIVAAGNSYDDMAHHTPAAYPEVLTVTAEADFDGKPGGEGVDNCLVNQDDAPAFFSNYTRKGDVKEASTIAAPGVCVLSLLPGNKMAMWSGTSMATPHVTGTAALCIYSGACDRMSPAELSVKLVADSLAQPEEYGFAGDAHHTTKNGQMYYGALTYAGSY